MSCFRVRLGGWLPRMIPSTICGESQLLPSLAGAVVGQLSIDAMLVFSGAIFAMLAVIAWNAGREKPSIAGRDGLTVPKDTGVITLKPSYIEICTVDRIFEN